MVVLGQEQQGHRSDQHWPRHETQRLCFQHLLDQRSTLVLKSDAVLQLGHQVVVVGVEPLGHLQRTRLARLAFPATGLAASHQEVRRKIASRSHAAKALGNDAELQRQIEHVVVEREITDRDPRGAAALLG